MKYTTEDLKNANDDNHPLWWIRQLTKKELTQIAEKLSLDISLREKKATFLKRILAVTDFTTYTGLEYIEAMKAAKQAKKSPVGIIIHHTDNDWTKRAWVTIGREEFPGMVNVGARIIAIRAS